MAIAIGLACAGCQSTSATGPAVKATTPVARLVIDKANEHNVPTQLAFGILKKESGLNPKVVHRGNYGIGQIRCGTAKGVGFKGSCNQLLDAETNLIYSMKYLRMALDLSKNDWCHAATLYNRGLGTKAKQSPYCQEVLRLSKLTEH